MRHVDSDHGRDRALVTVGLVRQDLSVVIKGTRLTQSQVLGWNSDWSKLDHARIANALDVFPDWAIYNLPPGKGEIGIWIHGPTQSTDPFDRKEGQERWHRGLIIHRGWLEWPGGVWTRDLDKALFPRLREGEKDVFDFTRYFEWFPLSTMGHTGPRGAPGADKLPAVCPACHTTLPATGLCDYCC